MPTTQASSAGRYVGAGRPQSALLRENVRASQILTKLSWWQQDGYFVEFGPWGVLQHRTHGPCAAAGGKAAGSPLHGTKGPGGAHVAASPLQPQGDRGRQARG